MITLKYWNSLSIDCRKAIVRIISSDSDHDNEIIKEYHHSFDYDITGKKLKAYLSRVFLTKDKKLKVFTELLPTFSPSDDTIKKVQKKQIKNNYPVAHKYYFRMYTKNDSEDGETIWEMAYSEAEAREKAYSDFHSIVELNLIRVV